MYNSANLCLKSLRFPEYLAVVGFSGDGVAVSNTYRDDISDGYSILDEKPTLGYSIPDEIPTNCFQLCKLV